MPGVSPVISRETSWRSAVRRSCRNVRGRSQGTARAVREPRRGSAGYRAWRAEIPSRSDDPVVDVREHASICSSRTFARASSGGASRPAISTVPATRSPCSIGRDAERARLVGDRHFQLDAGFRQRGVVAALGLQRQPDAKRVQQLPRPRTRRDHDLARRAPAYVGHNRIAAAFASG